MPATSRCSIHATEPLAPFDDLKRFARADSYARNARGIPRRLSYGLELEEPVERYGYAPDSRELGSSLVELCSVLERLTGTEHADYDRMIQRVDFAFERPHENRPVLEQTRRRHNDSVCVHEGHEDPGPGPSCTSSRASLGTGWRST